MLPRVGNTGAGPASQVSHPVSSSHDLINTLSFGRVRIAGAHDPAEREDVK